MTQNCPTQEASESSTHNRRRQRSEEVASLRKYKKLKIKVQETMELNRSLAKIIARLETDNQALQRKNIPVIDDSSEEMDDDSSVSSTSSVEDEEINRAPPKAVSRTRRPSASISPRKESENPKQTQSLKTCIKPSPSSSSKDAIQREFSVGSFRNPPTTTSSSSSHTTKQREEESTKEKQKDLKGKFTPIDTTKQREESTKEKHSEESTKEKQKDPKRKFTPIVLRSRAPTITQKAPEQPIASTSRTTIQRQNSTAGTSQSRSKEGTIASSRTILQRQKDTADSSQSRNKKDIVASRKYHPVKRDKDGKLILPQQIGSVSLLSLGKIKTKADNFHTKHYIYPVGYTIQRAFESMSRPNSMTLYTLAIEDGGNVPIFKVTAEDQPNEPMTSVLYPSNVIVQVLDQVNKINRKKVDSNSRGPLYFGLQNATVAWLIQQLPGSKKLRNYNWKVFKKAGLKSSKATKTRTERQSKELEKFTSSSSTAFSNKGRGNDEAPASATSSSSRKNNEPPPQQCYNLRRIDPGSEYFKVIDNSSSDDEE